ncbi:unnamed protein product [Pleuronectes platessa]|uniref:Uncharacterized protein n=1 Tax=Pleuronectes platessa TaxID=8262 RepID=A0A9N7W1I4_PLEPL|nr:unnamed protein product [Pleuronectes platessa]
MWRSSSFGAHHPAVHIVLWRSSSFGAHHPAVHIVLRRTSSCGAHRPAAHIVLRRTSSCGALHSAVHIIGGGLARVQFHVELPLPAQLIAVCLAGPVKTQDDDRATRDRCSQHRPAEP